MHCLSCHYSLKNLTPRGGEHRCPECGRAFDPTNPATFDSPLFRRWLVKRLVVPFVVCAVLSYTVTFGCVWYLQANSPTNDHEPVPLVTLINWPFSFGFLFIGFTFVLPRLAKKQA